ncbi:hypothetical protein LXL04_008896 [Taraxacum kok-saghyz]
MVRALVSPRRDVGSILPGCRNEKILINSAGLSASGWCVYPGSLVYPVVSCPKTSTYGVATIQQIVKRDDPGLELNSQNVNTHAATKVIKKTTHLFYPMRTDVHHRKATAWSSVYWFLTKILWWTGTGTKDTHICPTYKGVTRLRAKDINALIKHSFRMYVQVSNHVMQMLIRIFIIGVIRGLITHGCSDSCRVIPVSVMKFSRIYLLSYYNSLQHLIEFYQCFDRGLHEEMRQFPTLLSINQFPDRRTGTPDLIVLFPHRELQSYLSDLTLFLTPDSKNFYVLVDNRPWLQDLASRPAHLWQLMVTKVCPQMSPFANTRGRKGRKNTKESIDHKTCSKPSIRSQNFKKWFSVVDAAALSGKRALLPVKKLRSSLLANSKLHRTLYGFIVFQVMWKDTDTSLAIEAKYMKRWEFDSIS